jgi:hypothetical protein
MTTKGIQRTPERLLGETNGIKEQLPGCGEQVKGCKDQVKRFK